jgi:hypothetical protein
MTRRCSCSNDHQLCITMDHNTPPPVPQAQALAELLVDHNIDMRQVLAALAAPQTGQAPIVKTEAPAVHGIHPEDVGRFKVWLSVCWIAVSCNGYMCICGCGRGGGEYGRSKVTTCLRA